jgi:hypothetical protein
VGRAGVYHLQGGVTCTSAYVCLLIAFAFVFDAFIAAMSLMPLMLRCCGMTYKCVSSQLGRRIVDTAIVSGWCYLTRYSSYLGEAWCEWWVMVYVASDPDAVLSSCCYHRQLQSFMRQQSLQQTYPAGNETFVIAGVIGSVHVERGTQHGVHLRGGPAQGH